MTPKEKRNMKKLCEFQHVLMLNHPAIQSMTNEEKVALFSTLKNIYNRAFAAGRISMRSEVIREIRKRHP